MSSRNSDQETEDRRYKFKNKNRKKETQNSKEAGEQRELGEKGRV